MNEVMKCTFLGDVMCKSELIEAFRSKDGFEFSDMFFKISPFLKQSDLVFANLETPISHDNSTLTTETYCFNSPFDFARAVKEAGINVVATANNHCLDRGIDGIKSTVDSLNKLGFIHSGVFAAKSSKERNNVVIEKNGIRFGFLSYTYGTNAFSNHQYLKSQDRWRVNLFQNQELSNRVDKFFYYHRNKKISRLYNRIVEKLCPGQISGPVYERREFDYRCKKRLRCDISALRNEGADIIILYMHAGGQYNPEATSYTKKLAKYLMNHGVDWVIGTHEHVVHGSDFSNVQDGKFSTYSLGNFDGIAGVYADPMDKMAEYSIALHVYVNAGTNIIKKITFSILKTVETNNRRIQVIPCYELYQNLTEKDKESLFNDMITIANAFAFTDIVNLGVKKEYSIIE